MSDCCCQHAPVGGPSFRQCACGSTFWVAGSHEWARDKCPACEVKAAVDLIPEEAMQEMRDRLRALMPPEATK